MQEVRCYLSTVPSKVFEQACLVISFLVLFCTSCHELLGQNLTNEIDIVRINQEIKNLVASKDGRDFNGSILIAMYGEIIAQHHYGYSTADSLQLIDANSRFNVGSLAKEIPAIAILDLVRDGHLDYSNTISQFVDSLPDWSARVTIHDLLYYRSGMPSINFRVVQNDAQALSQLRKMTRLPFDPGSIYIYSNWNNFLLAKIVEAIKGVGFQNWVKRNYFTPLEINSSFYDSTVSDTTVNMTRSFSKEFGDDQAGNPNFKKFKLCYAPLYMTIGDVKRWIEFVYREYSKGGKQDEQFFQPTSVHRQGPLGLLEFKDGQILSHKHGGYAYSYGMSTYQNYENGILIIVMTNKNQENLLSYYDEQILKILDEH